MINRSIRRRRLFLVLLGLCLATAGAWAQQGMGGGMGRGGARSGSGVARSYPGNGMIGDAVITSDPETRRIVVITDDETAAHISQVITNLDRPKPQVLIKVVFLEVTYRNNSDIGIEGTFSKKVNSTTTGSVSNLFGMTAGLPGGQGAFPVPPGAGLYQILGSDYQATLRAIAQAGKTEVLSRPSILARNNQPAVITIGQSLPFITNVRYDTLNQPINTIQYQDVGIILRVTPFITSDGMVEMIVAPEISSLTDQTVTMSAGVSAPVIAKRSADTVVVTPDGQTVIIGGLMQNSKTLTDSKIPILGDIPLLGLAFKRKVKSDTKTELLIFLTPHVVTQAAQLAALSAREQSQAEMPSKAFSEKELNRFIDTLPVKQETAPETPKAPSKSKAPSGKGKPKNTSMKRGQS